MTPIAKSHFPSFWQLKFPQIFLVLEIDMSVTRCPCDITVGTDRRRTTAQAIIAAQKTAKQPRKDTWRGRLIDVDQLVSIVGSRISISFDAGFNEGFR